MGVRRRRTIEAGFLATLVAVLVVLPAGSLAAGASAAQPAAAVNCSNASSSEGVTAQVNWNGVNICSYGSASSSLGVVFTSTADVRFFWNDSTQAVNINDARLQMFYFGFALSTRDIIESGSTPSQAGPSDGIDMSWNPGVLTYVLAGLYGLTASLLTTNGTTVWSENFYVKATAPYTILAILPLVLLIIAILELFSVARSGRAAAAGAKAPPPPAPPPPTAPTTAAPSAPPPEETPETAAPPPAEPETPPPEEPT